MRIGLDFDNTLVNYDHVFALESQKQGILPKGWCGNKKELREKLLSRPNGEKIWQTLQGRVYGRCMEQAMLFPGVAQFLIRSKHRKEDLFIVSHKTKFGHFDATRTPLREAALKWMGTKGFFDKNRFGIIPGRVFFTKSRKEKVEKIKNLNLDVFIDDLEEVFAEEGFPAIKKVLFCGNAEGTYHDMLCENWSKIGEEILGPMKEYENVAFAQILCKKKILEVSKYPGRGNSRIYRVFTTSGTTYSLKFYPDLFIDPRPRLQTEVMAYRFLKDIRLTPKAFEHDNDLNIALFEWIEGESPRKIKKTHIDQALEFIEKLKELSKFPYIDFPQASEACFSAVQLYSQLEDRIRKLESVQHENLQLFLKTTFKPLWQEVRDWSESQWPSSKFESELSRSKQILSPSDFGFHNAVERHDGNLCFLDFEYFGWDDPVKLIADFIWHPGMQLELFQKKYWLEKMFGIFKHDIDLQSRFCASWPVYGLRWTLILLNEFHQEGWKNRIYANQDIENKREKILEEQLQKSSNICQQIQNQYNLCPYT